VAIDTTKRPSYSSKGISCPILSLSDANTVATIAIGLASAISPNLSGRTEVTSRDISRAYDILVCRRRERKAWSDTAAQAALDAKKEDTPAEDTPAEDPVVRQVKSAYLPSNERELLDCIVDPREDYLFVARCLLITRSGTLSTTFNDVCVDSNVVESLQKVVSLPLLCPSYFKTGVLAKEAVGGVLLYGPPGTGKTMLCRALAHICKARMLLIRPSDINRKYLGESEQKIAAIFVSS
jgi:hypothetical protein